MSSTTTYHFENQGMFHMEQWIWLCIGFFMGAVGFAGGARFASESKNRIIRDLQRALDERIGKEATRRMTRAQFDEESM